MGGRDDGLVAEVRMFHPTPSTHTVSSPSPCRKVFGDNAKDPTSSSKKLRITTATAYRLMKKQTQRAGSGTGEQEEQVRLGEVQATPDR